MTADVHTCLAGDGDADAAEGTPPVVPDLTAADVMSRVVVTVDADESVVMAGYVMQQTAVRHLPVVRHGTVVGIVDDVGLASCLSRLTWSDLRRPVRTAMRPEVVRVHPGSPLRDVARSLGYSPVRAVLVMDGDRLVGVVTDRDVVAAVARDGGGRT